MKKLILLIVLAFSLSINAQNTKDLDKSSKTIETVYNDSKKGISTVYNDLKSTTPQIKNALESLSKELKTTTDSLWRILVKQQLVWSWCFLILLISSIFNWILFYKRNLNNNLKYDKVKVVNQKLFYGEGTTKEDSEKYPNSYGAKYKNIEEEELQLIPNSTIPYFKYLHLAICLTLSVFSFIHFSDMLTGFINPEFGALKTITEVVKNLK
jgi:hypothetical protein